MKLNEIYEQVIKKRSCLCIGLDTDIDKIPAFLRKESDPLFAFNKIIIDRTNDLCVAYKLNTAFYEAQGAKGWESLAKTIEYIPDDIFIIADAKRGDIGNTSKQYAKAFFENLGADAITLSPYMGEDAIAPYLEYDNKAVIILALTSNKSSADFQFTVENNEKLYEKVIRISKEWASSENLMFVVGASHPEELAHIRQMIPEYWLLIPGVGAQQGDLQAVVNYGLNDKCGILVNSSRGIIYAGDGESFGDKAREAAQVIQQQIGQFLDQGLFEKN